MTNIRLSCPSCDRELELPSHAVGRLAQCPACRATFRVAAENTPEPDVASASPVEEASSQPATETVSAPETRSETNAPSPADIHSEQRVTPEPPEPTDAPEQAASPEQLPNPVASPVASPFEEGIPAAQERPMAAGKTEQPSVPLEPDHAMESGPDHINPNATEANPFTSPLESGMAAPMPKINPFEPTTQNVPVAVFGDIEVVQRSFEQVFSPTISIFGARIGQLLLAFFLAVLMGIASFGGWTVVMVAIDESVGDPVTSLVGIASLPLLLFFACYLTVGLARNAIAIARNDPSPFRELLPPMRVVLRFMMGGILLTLGLGALVGIGALILDTIAPAVFSEEIIAVAWLITVFGSTVVSMAGYWLLWAWVFIVSDGKAGIVKAFRVSWTLTMQNRMTSLILVIVAVILSTAGTATCYVGLLFTQPLTNVMFAVAYLLMTNQVIRVANDPPPDPSQDDFWQ